MKGTVVSLRMKIRTYKGTTVYENTVYGLKPDSRTIIAEGYTFRAGRKAGFGKSTYICERINDNAVRVIIDRIEEIKEVA